MWRIWALRAITDAVTDIDHLSAIHESVYDGVGDGGISQGLSPFFEADAGGENDGELVLRCVDQAEEDGGIFWFGEDVLCMVDNQKVQAEEGGDQIIGGVVGKGSVQPVEKVLKRIELDMKALLAGGYPEGRGDMGFSCACFAQDNQGVRLGDKAQVLKVFELFDVESGLEVPIEGIETHVVGELGLFDPSIKGSVVDGSELMVNQLGKELEVALFVGVLK